MSEATRVSLNSEPDSEIAAADCLLAYDVATKLITHAGEFAPQLLPLSDLILGRLGNFPAKSLLARSFDYTAASWDPFVALESVVRAEENAASEGGVSHLTDFQVRLLKELRARRYVSVSAPTSAGKSTTLELDLLYSLRGRDSFLAVYLVPTRALIRQVSLDLTTLLRENGIQASILSSISVPEPRQGVETSRAVFVLTQERYATLLAEAPASFNVDALVVDEAQEVGKAQRGITLERVVTKTKRKFPACRMFFSTPLRSNPDYLLKLFSTNPDQSSSFVEYQRPVSQRIILVKAIAGKPSKALLQMAVRGEVVDLATVDLPFPFRGAYLANIANLFTDTEDTSIIYCNRSSDADRRAEQLGDTLVAQEKEELIHFASFLREEIHPQYRLADLIEKGIAFHYGTLPHIVRSRVEELAKAKTIRFTCCTSTLLQGVNLPAKNIFVDNPKLGQGPGSAMQPTDFWNLVGRAGRMNYEFSGNVFCVFGKKWESDPLSGSPLAPIESALEIALTERLPELAKWAEDPPSSAESSEAWAEQAYANIYGDYVVSRRSIRELRPEIVDLEAVEKLDSASISWFEKKTLPDELYEKNLYVHPSRLEELAKYFRNHHDLNSLKPRNPFAFGAYDSLTAIFEIIENVFVKSGIASFRYFAFLASNWMKGESMRALIQSRLDYRRIPNEKKAINDEIRETFREIENDLRYRYVKYTSLYLQVLQAVMAERGESDEARRLLPLNVFLEFGAAEIVLINLMSLGLSRTSALLFRNRVRPRSDMSLQECRDYIRVINLDRIDLPAICRAELRQLQV